MATKKPDFSSINTSKVYQSIETATSRKGQQGEVSPAEAAERAGALRTQGRKGCKAIRINMAFTPDNHEFIKIMAGITGQTMTEFTNFCITRYRTEHPELYEQARAIKEKL